MQNNPRYLDAAFSTDGRSQRRRLISLTPLIDVVFILLIFFMMATNLLEWRAIPLSTAAGKQASSQQGVSAILVRVKSDSRPVLNGVPVNEDELGLQVKKLLKSRSNLRVLVQPDSGVPLQQTVAVVDVLAAAGAGDVVLIRR